MRKRHAQYISQLETARDALATENEALKNTVIRMSVPTELGIRPIYQATLATCILATLIHGGNGLKQDWIQGPVQFEVVSQWKPPIKDEDYDDNG